MGGELKQDALYQAATQPIVNFRTNFQNVKSFIFKLHPYPRKENTQNDFLDKEDDLH